MGLIIMLLCNLFHTNISFGMIVNQASGMDRSSTEANTKTENKGKTP